MKKEYVKPEIVFESFKLTTSIANTCGGLQANQADGNECELVDSGWKIFISGVNDDCDPYTCYHVAPDSSNVFGS